MNLFPLSHLRRTLAQGVAAAAVLAAVSVSAAPVTLEWAPNTEANLAGYLVSYGTAPGQYGTTVDVGTQVSFQWTTPGTAVYYFAVRAYDADGQQSAYSAEVSTQGLVATLHDATLTASRPAPQAPGTPVTFTAAATGGTAPYAYQFWLISDATPWTVVRAWSPSATFTWTPTQANAGYQVAVWVRSAGNTVNAPEGSSGMSAMAFPIATATTPLTTSLTANRASPQTAGPAITVTAAAAGGTGPYAYKFWVTSDTTPWTLVQNWSTSPTLSWTPAVASHYQVAVWVRSAGSTTDAPEGATGLSTLPFEITAAAPVTPLALTSVTANRVSPQAPGTAVTVTAAATGGTGPYAYKFWLTSDTTPWTMVQSWGTSATFTWTPPASGNYVLAVWVRSAGSTTDAAETGASGSLSFSITAPAALTLTLAANKTAPVAAKTTVVFTATPHGAAAGRYQWAVSDGTTWTVVQDWAASATFSWKPKTANSRYQVRVRAETAAAPTVIAEAMLAFPITK